MLALVVAAVCVGCPAADTGDATLPAGLGLSDLNPEQRAVLRLTAEVPGRIAPTPLLIDPTTLTYSGSLPIVADDGETVPVIMRLSGRFAADRDEVLLGRADLTLTVAKGSDNQLALTDSSFVVDAAFLDDNDNGVANLADLRAGVDPAPPPPALDVSPSALQFPSGTSPGAFAQQVIVVENTSGAVVTVDSTIVGPGGLLLGRVQNQRDLADAPPAGRTLGDVELQPFEEALLAVTFAPQNTALVRGSVALRVRLPADVVQTIDVPVLGNPEGALATAPAGYAPAPFSGALTGVDVVHTYAASSLFSGTPLPASDAGAAPIAFDDDAVVAGVRADRSFLIEVPTGHRFSAAAFGVVDNLDLHLFALSTGDVVVEPALAASTSTGTSLDFVEVPPTADSAGARRLLLVVSRKDTRQSAGDVAEPARFTIVAQAQRGPEIDTVTPESGAFSGSTTLTITGHGFAVDAAQQPRVRIGDSVASDVVVNADGTQLTAVTPPGDFDDAGNALVVVVDNPEVFAGGDGQSATYPAGFRYLAPAPRIDAVDPSVLAEAGGNVVTIDGAFFSRRLGVPRVTFGGVAGTTVGFVSATRLIVTAPALAPGNHLVVVENLSEDGVVATEAPATVTVVAAQGPAPVVTSITPARGTVDGGEVVVVAGSDFLAGAQLRIGGVLARDLLVVDGGTITATTPAAVFGAGSVDVVVTNPDGQADTIVGGFVYEVPAPAIAEMTPGTVSTLGGTRVVVDGAGFRAPVTVTLSQGATPFVVPASTLTVVSRTRLAFTTPAGLFPGGVDVVVTAAGGRSTAVPLTVVAPTAAAPDLQVLSPSEIAVDAIGLVRATGTGFSTGLQLLIDDEPVTIDDVTATTFSFTAPARPIGTSIVRVINADGQSDVAALLYVAGAAPSLGTVTPGVVGAGLSGERLVISSARLPVIDAAAIRIVDLDNVAVNVAVTKETQTGATLVVRSAAPIPEGDRLAVRVDLAAQGLAAITSDSFSAVLPTAVNFVVANGTANEVSAFDVVVSGVGLNPARLTTMRFDNGAGTAIDVAPAQKTASLVRSRVIVGALPQGIYAVSLHYGTDLVIDVPGDLVVVGPCGNGVADTGEACDGGDFGVDGSACTRAGFAGGTLSCSPFCALVTTQCTRCGDGIVDEGEQCDGANVDGESCGSLGFNGGTLTCTSACRFNANACARCGDGVIGAGEQCDGTNLAGQSCTTRGFNRGALRCDDSCQLDDDNCSTCGNNRCELSETNANCAADCVASCGNGTCDGNETCTTCPGDCSCAGPFALTLVSGGNQTVTTSSAAGAPVIVSAVDGAGQPLVGLELTFAAPPGVLVQPATARVDAFGQASTLITAGRTTGPLTLGVTGRDPVGGELRLNVQLTVVDIAVGQIQTLVNQAGVAATTALPAPGARSTLNITTNGAGDIAVRASTGDIFISETNAHRVLRLDAQGVLSVVAGIGVAGFSGDNGPASAAQLSSPRSLAIDASGNLFVADRNNNRIRRISTSGIITTVVGGGTVRDDGVLGSQAQIEFPVGLAFDSGELYFGTDGNQTSSAIRKLRTNNTIETVVAVASCSTNNLRAFSVVATRFAFDADHRLVFVGSVSNVGGCPVANGEHVLRREVDGTFTSLMGGNNAAVVDAPARGATLAGAQGVAVDAAGNVYVAEETGHRIRRITPFGLLSTLAGTGTNSSTGDLGPASNATIGAPGAMQLLGTDLIVVGAGSRNVRRLRGIAESTAPSATVTVLGAGQSTPIGSSLPGAIGVRVVDNVGRPIAGAVVTAIAPAGGAVEPATLTTDNGGIASFTAFVPQLAGPTSFGFNVLPPDNRLPAGNPFAVTATASALSTGTVYAIANQLGRGVGVLPGPATRRQLDLISLGSASIAIDVGGNVYFADAQSNRIVRVTPAGEASVVAGTGVGGNAGDGAAATSALLLRPSGIARDVVGNLYISDTGNRVVRVVRPSGIIERFAGGGPEGGNNGDGLVATSANLLLPGALALSPSGDALYIVDTSRQNIRRVAIASPGVPGAITTFAAGRSCNTASGAVFAGLTDGAVVVDSDGNVIVGGNASNAGGCPLVNEEAIFRIAANGTQTVVMGGPTERSSGPAAGTSVRRVAGLAHDVAGNLYVSESGNGSSIPARLRRIDHLGRMTSIATPPANGNAGNYGPVADMRFNNPGALAFRGNDLIFVDRDNHSVRSVVGIGRTTPERGTLSLISGNAQQTVINTFVPNGLVARVVDATSTTVPGLPISIVAADPGDLVPAEQIDTNTSGQISATVRAGLRAGTHTITVAANTWLTPRPLQGSPLTITFTANRPSPRSVLTVVNALGAGSGTPQRALETRLNVSGFDDGGLHVFADGTLLVSDTNNARVLQMLPEGIVTFFAGTGTLGFGDNSLATEVAINRPTSIAVDADGNVLFADTGNRRVRRVDVDDNNISTLAGGGASDPGNGLPPTAASVDPRGVAVAADGSVFIVDDSRGLRRIAANGQSLSTVRSYGVCNAANGVIPSGPRGANVVVDDAGGVLFVGAITFNSGCPVASTTIGNSQVFRFDPATNTTTVIAGTGISTATNDGGRADQTRFDDIRGLARDPVTGDLYVSERARHTVRRIAGGTASGIVTTVAGQANTSGNQLLASPGTALLNGPMTLFFDEEQGDLWILEEGNDDVKVLVEP